jgi:hypothetical protein
MTTKSKRECQTAGAAMDRRGALGLVSSGLAVSLAGSGWAEAADSARRPLLGTPDQLAAERMLMRLNKDPDILRLQAQLKAELLLTAIGKSAAGAATIERAVAQWTNSQFFNEVCTRRRIPTFLWGTDDTPRTWFGYTLGGVGTSGDNPDNVYRTAIIDGTKNYEILGWKDQTNPAEQLVIQVDKANMLDPASMFDMKSKMPSIVGATMALFQDRDLKIAPDGSFRITLGSGEQGPVHVPLRPGNISLGVRDLLADWRQRPSKLVVRELGSGTPIDRPVAEELDYAMIKQHLVEDLPGYVRFWARFPEIWFGGLKPNSISAPRGRVGGWGFVAGCNFALAPDEAAIITTTRGQAVYTGFQINDPWMIQPDAKRYQVCLNSSQAKPGPDGSFTYVISQTDPGVANWLDTTGVNSGIGILRWQKVPADMTGEGLIREYKVMKLTDVDRMTQLPRVSPEDRRAVIAERAAAYSTRAS